jgi:hypothetical protein
MKPKSTNFITQNKNIFLIALATALILLLPLAAMQFTAEVNWSPFDFAVAGTLLFGAGLAYELVTRKARSIAYRAAVGAALGTGLLLLWVDLAAGIIGSEDNPANWMYVGVLAVVIAGTLVVRFRPGGMERVLYAAALLQALTVVIALIAGLHRAPDSSVLEILGVNGFFAALWAGSALLFRRAEAAMKGKV